MSGYIEKKKCMDCGELHTSHKLSCERCEMLGPVYEQMGKQQQAINKLTARVYQLENKK